MMYWLVCTTEKCKVHVQLNLFLKIFLLGRAISKKDFNICQPRLWLVVGIRFGINLFVCRYTVFGTYQFWGGRRPKSGHFCYILANFLTCAEIFYLMFNTFLLSFNVPYVFLID